MTKEKEDRKIGFYSRYHAKIFIFLGISVIVLILISITFIVRTIFTGPVKVPILRFNIAGGFLAFLSLLHAIFTVVIYRSRDKEAPYRILLILTLIFDILLVLGGIVAATEYIGIYPPLN